MSDDQCSVDKITKLANSPGLLLLNRVAVILSTVLISILTMLSSWTLQNIVEMKTQMAGVAGEVQGHEGRITMLEHVLFEYHQTR